MNKERRREIALYLIFGVLTTLVNFAIWGLLTLALGEERYLINNAAAWLAAVIFAYFANKLLVFGARSARGAALLREAAEFFGARIASLVIEEAGLFLLIELLGMGDISFGIISGQMMAKILLAIVVVATNYLFSKFIIFKKN